MSSAHVPSGSAPARRRLGWVLVASVLLSWLLAAASAALGVVPSAATAQGGALPVGGATAGGPDVVLVGIPGLTWDLVDETRTPTLAVLARQGGTGALVVRGTHEVTCAADAWLTLGAGQRAATDLAGCGDAKGSAVTPAQAVGGGRPDPAAWERWRGRAATRALAPQLGTLARLAQEGGTCVDAQGAGAVVGAAGPAGELTAPGGSTCRIHLIELGPVLEGDRSGALRAVDDEVATLARTHRGSTLVVAGLGHTAGRAEATVLITWPSRMRDGAGASLSSGSTHQRGLVQLTDLTPTLLSLAGVEPARPADLAGGPVTAAAQEGDQVTQARDLARAVSEAKAQAPWVLGTLLAVLGPLLLLGLVLGRRGRPGLLAPVATVALATPAAAFLAGLVPWWRADQPWPALVGVVLLGAVLVAAVAWAGPWRRDPLAPSAVVAALTLVVLGVDVIWSARLGLVSVLGLQPVTAGRFYGQGNVGFGVVLGCVLVLMGALLSWLRPRGGRSWEAAAAVAVLGVGATAVNVAPQAGADFGGAPALVVATGLVTLPALGVRWRPATVLGVGLAAGAVTAGVMVLDWARGPERRTHLGAFVQALLDGEALGIVSRKLHQSLAILTGYPVSWLAVLALVATAVVVLRRPAWSGPLWRWPGLSPVALAGLAAMALAWALNDSGVAAVAMSLTVLVSSALTVLGRGPGPRGEGRLRAGEAGGP